MMDATLLPLTNHALDDVIAWDHGRAVHCGEFLAQAARLAASLPPASHAVNLCEDRYRFILAFTALLLRGQVNLLPPSRAVQVVEEVAARFPGSYCLVDTVLMDLGISQVVVAVPIADERATTVPLLSSQALAAILFTSGSTGVPSAHRKYWADLVRGTARARQRLALAQRTATTLVATVPPQHMFGLEFTVLAALLGPLTVHGGRPFYPEDLRRALAEVPSPRVLVTTPVHLRACVAAGLAWPAVDYILSATAPLSVELAVEAEQVFGCDVHEVYGCTETGAIASRRTLDGGLWQLFEGVCLQCTDGRCTVSADFLRETPLLNDVIELRAEGFVLHGRDGDMLNIAGKRTSLGDLTHRLLEIHGVTDAAVVVLDEQQERGGRLCALVVAPLLTEAEILAALRRSVDPVFLPRPLWRVAGLPRNEAGKLSRAELLVLIGRLRRGDGVS